MLQFTYNLEYTNQLPFAYFFSKLDIFSYIYLYTNLCTGEVCPLCALPTCINGGCKNDMLCYKSSYSEEACEPQDCLMMTGGINTRKLDPGSNEEDFCKVGVRLFYPVAPTYGYPCVRVSAM